jgi:hypothetical protein
MPTVKYDHRKGLIDLSEFDATKVNNAVKREIVDYGAQAFDEHGFVWVRDPRHTVPIAFGSITAAAERMRRELVLLLKEQVKEASDYLDKLDSEDYTDRREWDKAEEEYADADRALKSAQKSRVGVKMVTGRKGEYGMRFHLSGGAPSKAARRLAHAWMVRVDQGLEMVLDGFDLLEEGWEALSRTAVDRQVRDKISGYLKATQSLHRTLHQWKDDLMLVERLLPPQV